MSKRTVAIFFGGVSSEHEVSCISAASVVRNIDTELFDVVTVGITRDGRWLLFSGTPEQMEDGSWEDDPANVTAFVSPDRSIHGLVLLGENGDDVIRLDAVFPVLHGKNGEDGTMQGLLELAGIPYVGCPVLGSAVCMDKAVANALMDCYGIKHTAWRSFTEWQYDELMDGLDALESELGYPMFVKPANAGSSVGITKAHDREELKNAVKLAFENDSKIVIEKNINGRELECSVFGNGNKLTVSVIGEILPANEFYDYEAKYSSADSETLIPAELDAAKSDEIRAIAAKVFRALGCEGLSRVDFLLEDGTGIAYVNELNTIPGFTAISMYGKLMDHSGVPFKELITGLIDLAIERMK